MSSGQKSSHTETSKLIGVRMRKRSCSVQPKVPIRHSRLLTMAPCGTTTALGLPVEPEV
ncbi:predicted protein [Streptomyces iranensis]|uniref:Uncharacterized protein n=1 Tax=Streptomyces iranensis TaxID=576784 RepID=A0A060ZNU9_9ACTN|nr:predicted protein [Streptomyces iranensis]